MPALAYRAAELLARCLPVRAADALASALAGVAWAARVPARAALERNLERAYPAVPAAERRVLGRRTFASFARTFTDFLRLHRTTSADLARTVRVRGGEHLDAARRSGRGVIVLSVHMGDWERGAAFLASLGVPLHLAAREHAGGSVERLFHRRRSRFGVRTLPRSPLFRSATAALRRGEWIALMADRGATPLPGGPSVCAWAAALATRTNALVLPVVLVRDSGRSHTLHVGAPMSPERCRNGAFREAMHGWLSAWPGQWAAFEPLPEGVV
jgi:KDO2-lipid IV(A) lauroyltransferase